MHHSDPSAQRVRRRRRRSAAATAVALAVAGGLLLAPGAGAEEPQAAPDGAAREITLLTGDRVRLDAAGDVTGVRPGPGREDIPISVAEGPEGTFVIPADARRLIGEGLVDQRLFDVAELSRPEYGRPADGGLPVIVRYAGDRPARLFADGGPEVRAELDSIDAEAWTVAPDETATAWEALTGPRTLSSGVARIALDGVRTASLDRSVPQIGVPAAWESGLDGTGVTVAVLDTGIDVTHPDLDGSKVAAAANFSDSPGTEDRYGHGTHVASITAGTTGDYTGVAPGATLLNGKVLDDFGNGADSGIIAGMEWAVEQGADIVNMSLGSEDTPGVDLLEEAVNRLSADTGVLFVISAGNDGPRPGTLGSPGTADAALTVGSVDEDDALATSSSIGPRLEDSAVKPDLTAPGVDIAAAAAEGSYLADGQEPVAEGYMNLSGTSMAAPHVAGAAALLAQQHPDWSGDRLKAALVASADPVAGYGAFQQGAGRTDVSRAVGQTVVAEPVSVGFGEQEWPHADNEPVARELTYRNLGTEDVTLDLSVEAVGPDGSPAPADMFRLGADTVTVPAGGTAAVEATAHTALDETAPIGGYSMYVTATGGGQSVGVAGGIDLLREFHEVTLEGIGLDGGVPESWWLNVYDLTTGEILEVPGDPADGTWRLRLPADHDYLLISTMGGDGYSNRQTVSLPGLAEDTAVPLDARAAEPIDLTVPDPDAERFYTFANIALPSFGTNLGWEDYGPDTLMLTQHIGPALPEDELIASFQASWTGGENAEYHAVVERAGSQFTGHEQHFAHEDLAELRLVQGAPTEGATGRLEVSGSRRGALGPSRDLPADTTLYLTGGTWSYTLTLSGPGEAGSLSVHAREVTAGETYADVLGVGVFAPVVPPGGGIRRTGDRLDVGLTTVTDGAGHQAYLSGGHGTATLSYDGEVIHTSNDFIRGWAGFDVPSAAGRYELTTTAERPDAGVSTRISATFGFISASVPDGEEQVLPVSLVRFAPALAPDSSAPAGQEMRVPVSVEGAAAGDGLASLTVEVSYDGGGTWQETPVTDGGISVANPAAGGSVSFRAEVADRSGGTTELTLIDAYRTV